MSVPDKVNALGALVRTAKSGGNGSRAALDARIRKYEIEYEMTSDQMIERLRNDQIEETAVISDWLFWVDARSGRVPR